MKEQKSHPEKESRLMDVDGHGVESFVLISNCGECRHRQEFDKEKIDAQGASLYAKCKLSGFDIYRNKNQGFPYTCPLKKNKKDKGEKLVKYNKWMIKPFFKKEGSPLRTPVVFHHALYEDDVEREEANMIPDHISGIYWFNAEEDKFAAFVKLKDAMIADIEGAITRLHAIKAVLKECTYSSVSHYSSKTPPDIEKKMIEEAKKQSEEQLEVHRNKKNKIATAEKGDETDELVVVNPS